MRLNPFHVVCAALTGVCSLAVSAQSVAPAFSSVYSLVDLGTVGGLPTAFGGLTFKSGDANTLLIGGGANGSAGRIYAVPVVRGAGNHITAFGTPVAQGYGDFNDAGISYGPGGVLFHVRYPNNELVQVKAGANAASKVTGLAAKGIPSSPGAIVFVPPGFNGAGKLKISSYSNGVFYDVPFTEDGTGTFDIGTAVAAGTLTGGPEGLIYAPIGSPLFPNQTLLVTEYSSGKVAAYDVDGNANPIIGTRRDFVTGLSGGEGAAIDPVTGDFLFTTFGGGNKVIQVRGFTPPPPRATVTVTSSTNPSSFGASVTFTATVTGVAPLSGTVTFKDNGADIAGCVARTLSSATATCVTTALPVGAHTVAAYYGGNSTNSAGDGSVAQTIQGIAPTIVTGAAAAITASGASVAGTVGSGGLATAVAFDYGTTVSYGSSVNAAQSPLAATASGAAVSSALSGLACGTTYHYRVRAVNSVATSNGTDATFATTPCPTLSAISPDRGPLAGNTRVTLTGTGFAAGMTVNVDGVTGACQSLTLASSTSASCVMPSHAAGTASVAVAGAGGASNARTYTYDPVPTIVNASPLKIPTAGGTVLTITGSGFIAGATVGVNGSANTCRPVSVTSQTSLSCTMPAGAVGSVNIAVTTSGGTSAAKSLFYADVPEVTGVAPGRGPVAGGTAITVTGSSFSSVGGLLTVRIGGVACTSPVKVSDAEITCVTPSGVAGAAPVTVTTFGGTSVPGTFTFDNLPTVTAVKPSRGPLVGGTIVTVSGSSFIAGLTTVSLGGQPCTSVTYLSDAKVTCVVPAGMAGAVAVTVTTPGGTSAPGTYTFDDVPAITSVTPAQGPLAGGTLITLDGTSFVAGRTTVTVGGAACGNVTVIDAATATCVTPPQTAGLVEVRATTPGGTSAPAFFTYDSLPAVATVIPDQGPTAGGTTITITGSAFIAGSTTVALDGAACTGVTVTNDTTLTCATAAAVAGVKGVVVTTPGGASAPGFYTYDNQPVLKRVKPGLGPLAGGTTITLTGASFVAGTTVTVGGAPCATVTVLTDSTLTCVTPSGTSGIQDVIVTTPGGTSPSRSFTYADAPTLASVSPTTGPVAGGTLISLSGTSFAAGSTTVTVGGAACTAVAVSADTTLTCATPALPVGPAAIIATTVGGSSNTLFYLYAAVPTLATVAPARGSTAGGGPLTVTGTGFSASGTTVTVGGTNCAGINVTSTTQLTCVLPVGAAGATNVLVTTAGGTSNAGAFTYDASPTISTISPGNGPIQGGVTITLTGSGFVPGNSSVTVGGAACTAINVASPTSLTCVTPAGAGGPVPLILTTTGGTSAAQPFLYDPVPTLISVAPPQGPVGGGTTITLAGTGFVTGGTAVTVGGLPCASVNVVNGTSLTCVTPSAVQGAASVVVATLSGSSNGVSFLFDASPTLTSVTPSQGSIAGGATVVLTGLSFVAGGTTVAFGSAACTGVTLLGPTSLSCVTPAAPAGTVPVSVSTINGTSGTLPFNFAVVIVGACGSANGVTSSFKPATNLCSTGTASPVPIASPWSWTCAGSGGGATATCSAPNQNTATGTGAAFASLSGGTWVVDAANTSGFIPTTGHPKSPPIVLGGIDFPHGLLDFRLVGGTAGSAATVTITYPTALPVNATYWKYGPSPSGFNCIGTACATPHWYFMPASQAVISGNTVTLTIFDGGVGDDDLVANSIIVDQGGPGAPVAPVVGGGIPTLSEWGMLILATLMLFVGFRRLNHAPAGRGRVPTAMSPIQP